MRTRHESPRQREWAKRKLAAAALCWAALAGWIAGCNRPAPQPAAASVDLTGVEAKIATNERKLLELQGRTEEQLKALSARFDRLETLISELGAAQDLAARSVAAKGTQTADAATPAGGKASRVSSSSSTESTAPADSIALTGPAGAADLREVPEMTGRMGRLVVQFAEGADTSGAPIRVFAGGATADSPAISRYGPFSADLMPGAYSLDISGQSAGVFEIKSRHETLVHTGVLRLALSNDTPVQLHAPGEAEAFHSFYGSKDIALPVGDVEVAIAGRRELVSIERDQIKEF